MPTSRGADYPNNNYPPIFAGRDNKPRWWLFPDQLPNGEFRGYENRLDATKVRGAFVLGQNVKFRDSAQPTLREGYDPLGTEASNAYPVDRAWVFTTREGDVYELKAYNGGLYYWLRGTSTDFTLLKSGYTAGNEFGYANIGESGGAFHTMFCNGVEAWAEFNGAYATVASVTANTITKAGTVWNALAVPFYTTGSVNIGGVDYAYTGGAGTTTLTGVTPDPSAGGVVAGNLAVQCPRAPTFRVFLPFKAAASGPFTVGETVTGGTSGKTATVQRVAEDGTYIVVTSPSGNFTAGETLTGGSSGKTGVLNFSIDNTLGPPLASVIASHLSRMHCWSAVKRSVWAFSMLDDPYCWTVFSDDTTGGRKDIDFGGAGTAFGRLNQTIIGYKDRGLTTLQFVQTGQRTDVPVYNQIIQSDDKGTTVGAVGQKSTFTSPYGMVSVTTDDKMIILTGISANNQPDFTIISDPIQPTFTRGDHSNGSGVCVDGVIWYSYKASTDSGSNDAVLTGDLRRRSVDAYGNLIPLRWDVPFVGWQPADWTAVPSTGGGSDVHWHSSLNSNSYEVLGDQKVDNGGSFTALVRTWAESFGDAAVRKTIDRVFVEILLRENSIVNATLLYDDNGFTSQLTKVLSGAETQYRFGSTTFNPFGATPFGAERFGSNGEMDDRQRYRFYFELTNAPWFFNLSLSLESDTENSDFELIRWGVHVSDYELNTPSALAI